MKQAEQRLASGRAVRLQRGEGGAVPWSCASLGSGSELGSGLGSIYLQQQDGLDVRRVARALIDGPRQLARHLRVDVLL